MVWLAVLPPLISQKDESFEPICKSGIKGKEKRVNFHVILIYQAPASGGKEYCISQQIHYG